MGAASQCPRAPTGTLPHSTGHQRGAPHARASLWRHQGGCRCLGVRGQSLDFEASGSSFLHPPGHGQVPTLLRLRARPEDGWPGVGPVPSCSGGLGSSPGQEGGSVPVSRGNGEKAVTCSVVSAHPFLAGDSGWAGPHPKFGLSPRVTFRGLSLVPGGLAEFRGVVPGSQCRTVPLSLGEGRPGAQ